MTSPVVYTEKVPQDGDGKRIFSVAADTGAANELVHPLGGAPVTQHGETFAPMEVSSGQLLTSLGTLATDAHLQTLITDVGLLATDAHMQTLITDVGLLATDAHLTAMSAKLPAALVSAKLDVMARVRTLSGTSLPVYQWPMDYYPPLDSSTQVSASGVLFGGFLVNSSSNGTVKIWDSTTNSGDVIIDTMTVTAGQLVAFPWPLRALIGLYATVANCKITIFKAAFPTQSVE